MEEQNEKLLKALNAKEEELRTAQKPFLTSMSKPNDLKNRDDTVKSKVSILNLLKNHLTFVLDSNVLFKQIHLILNNKFPDFVLNILN